MPSMRVPIKKRQAWLRCARSDMVEREMIDSTAVIDRSLSLTPQIWAEYAG